MSITSQARWAAAALSTAVLLASTLAASSASQAVTSPEPCFNPEGGACLGPLAPGTYETTVFRPGIRYTVPDGWVNGEDLIGNFTIFRGDDPQVGLVGGSYVGIYADVRIPDGCEEHPDPAIGHQPADLVAWFVDHPGLATSRPRKVKVGGLRGMVVDVPLKKGYEGGCPWSEGHPVVPLIIGSGVSSLFHVSLHEIDVRLIVLKWKHTNVTVELTSVKSQHSHRQWMRIVRPIIRSLAFDADNGSSFAGPDTTLTLEHVRRTPDHCVGC
ncbi:MAG: hypothetical protein ABIO16_08830 [Nocardioides sp.]